MNKISKKKKNNRNKTKKNKLIHYYGGNKISAEQFLNQIENLISNIELKVINEEEKTPSKDNDNICDENYLDDCNKFQSLILEHIDYLSESDVFYKINTKINSISDESLRYSLLYIFYKEIDEDSLYKMYGVNNIAYVEPKEKSPSPKEVSLVIKETIPFSKDITFDEILETYLDTLAPLSDEELNLPNKYLCLNYCTTLINKIKKKKHDLKQSLYIDSIQRIPYNLFEKNTLYLEEFKLKIIDSLNSGSICNDLLKGLPNYITRSFLDVQTHQKVCIVFLLIGYLSKILFESKTCILLIKGGKAMQFYSKDMPSDDIDILIMPYKHKNEFKSLSNIEIDLIGKMITHFIL